MKLKYRSNLGWKASKINMGISDENLDCGKLVKLTWEFRSKIWTVES
jgi:hypothetical protein